MAGVGSGLSPLPIDDHVPAALASLRAGRNLVVLAEPGAGKTTRLPRAMLLAEAPAASGGEILVLEPRRIAARLAARRVASELGEAVGGRVGYTVRFEDRRGPATRLRFVTEGILVRQLARDATLPGVAAVVLDEFHERHLAGDLALAMLRRLQRRSRPELRLVAMSATLDPGPIAAFLAADVLRVPGRTHPVSLVHLGAPKEALERSVARAVRQALGDDGDGDVLVFLPGAGAIRRAEQACLPLARGGVELAMLHGDLPPDAQDRVLRPASGRKVILSTNVAESSVTLPAVTAVVDAGLVRRASVSPLTGLPVLATVPISQASATQRAGRAGRVRPGRAYRLFTEAELRRRPAADTPEIGRADLAELALLLRAQGEDPRRFPFFEAPPSEALDAALALLRRLRALEGKDRVTARGRALLRLPAHPRLGTVVLEAKAQDVGWRGARVAALIAEREVLRSARFGGDRASDALHGSDLVLRLEALEAAEAEGLRSGELRARGLDPSALATHRKAAAQLARAARVPSEPGASLADEEDALGLALLAGFPDRVAQRRGVRSARLKLAEGGEAELAEESAVTEAPLVVCVRALETRGEGRRRGGVRVRYAHGIEAEHLALVAPESLVESRTVSLDPATGRLTARAQLRYGALVLEDEESGRLEDEEAAEALADAALAAGLPRFVDVDGLEGYRRRVAFAAAQGAEGLAPVDAPALRAALVDLAWGHRNVKDLEGVDLVGTLRARLSGGARAALERLAPATVALPGRRAVQVTYEEDRDPWIASRLQDFFGLGEGPRVADGRVPLVLHLLAPNRRAVQVTTDLAGFWERHYPALRKELGRRYPKHAWPEDGARAKPPARRPRR